MGGAAQSECGQNHRHRQNAAAGLFESVSHRIFGPALLGFCRHSGCSAVRFIGNVSAMPLGGGGKCMPLSTLFVMASSTFALPVDLSSCTPVTVPSAPTVRCNATVPENLRVMGFCSSACWICACIWLV